MRILWIPPSNKGTASSWSDAFHSVNSCNYSEPHSQNRIFDASILLMWLPRHIKLLFCLNASIHRKQFCMALNSYIFFSLQLLQMHHTALWCMVLWCLEVYKSRAGKPRNFFQLSDNDVEFCRIIIQAIINFVLVISCEAWYTNYSNREHIFTTNKEKQPRDS